jgi:hypothetical protein
VRPREVALSFLMNDAQRSCVFVLSGVQKKFRNAEKQNARSCSYQIFGEKKVLTNY